MRQDRAENKAAVCFPVIFIVHCCHLSDMGGGGVENNSLNREIKDKTSHSITIEHVYL